MCCSQWHKFNKDMSAIKEEVFAIVNYADELFTKVGLRLALTHLHVSEEYTIKNNATVVSRLI